LRDHRLYGATYPGSVSEDYGYDWVGNRKNPPGGSNALVFNKVDQLTSRPGIAERTCTYDNLGNLSQIANPWDFGLKDFTYFGSGLLNRARFYYLSQYSDNYWDGDANRVKLDYCNGDDTYTWKFVYDVTAGIPAVVKEITPTTTVYYYREPGGELLARQEGTTGSTDKDGKPRIISVHVDIGACEAPLFVTFVDVWKAKAIAGGMIKATADDVVRLNVETASCGLTLTDAVRLIKPA
jgi:hypothetical protein